MVYTWFTHGFRMVSHGFRMVDARFRMIFAWFSHGLRYSSESSPENIFGRGRGPYMSRDQPMAHAFVCHSLVPSPEPAAESARPPG
jgi:hypothetical protein